VLQLRRAPPRFRQLQLEQFFAPSLRLQLTLLLFERHLVLLQLCPEFVTLLQRFLQLLVRLFRSLLQRAQRIVGFAAMHAQRIAQPFQLIVELRLALGETFQLQLRFASRPLQLLLHLDQLLLHGGQLLFTMGTQRSRLAQFIAKSLLQQLRLLHVAQRLGQLQAGALFLLGTGLQLLLQLSFAPLQPGQLLVEFALLALTPRYLGCQLALAVLAASDLELQLLLARERLL
jgi:hypothetical protein